MHPVVCWPTDLPCCNRIRIATFPAPSHRNKTLLFSHMLIEKGQNWYAELLRLSMPDASDLQINPRNCIGTVLALNGHRKYFCMYHAKHPESVRGEKVSGWDAFYFKVFTFNFTVFVLYISIKRIKRT